MNGELWAPGKSRFTKSYCGKRGSAAADLIIPSYSWDNDEEEKKNNRRNSKATNEQQLFLKTRNGNINNVLLRLRKVTATRQLTGDHSLTVKATKPKIQRNIQR
jgi:hypothetical protein